ncbi:MAG: hypothetical protein NUV50_04995 [Rhodospirillales bacterium]|nr:hypothetical protein [Rhodospirillales bacterium]
MKTFNSFTVPNPGGVAGADKLTAANEDDADAMRGQRNKLQKQLNKMSKKG